MDDVTQEVLCVLAFHRKPLEVRPRRGRPRRRARTARIAAATLRQLAEHTRRRAQLRRGDVLGAELFSARSTPSAEDLALAFAPIARLRRALEQLDQTEPALHAVLDLTTDGAPLANAAARLGIPVGTAWTRLLRARGAVRVLYHREACPRRAAGGVAGAREEAT